MWTKLDDGFTEHPKLAEVGIFGLALDTAGMVYCGRNLTDGFVPYDVAWRLIAGEETVIMGLDGEVTGDIPVGAVLERLANVGRWHTERTVQECPACLEHWPQKTTRGFYVHDFLRYNPSRAQVLAEREAAKKRRQKLDAPPNVARTSLDAPPNVSFPAPAPAPETEPSSEDQRLPADAGELNGFLHPPNGWTHAQASLVRKLCEEVSDVWLIFVDQPSKLNKLNHDLGKGATTLALQHAWEERLVPSEPYPMLRAMAQTSAKDVPA